MFTLTHLTPNDILVTVYYLLPFFMDKKIKILSWNIHHWWHKKYIDDIIQSIYKKDADINILTEYRENPNADKIKDFFIGKGFKIITSNPQNSDNWILLITRLNVKIKPYNYWNEDLPIHRWLDMYFSDYNFNILAVHIPWWWDKYDKRTYWEELTRYSLENKENNTVIIWDYNTGFKYDTQKSPFILWKYMYNLVDNWWIDLWNKFNPDIDFSWYSNHWNGFRIDHIFTTKNFVDNFQWSYFSHFEREAKFSDHSMLISELSIMI